MKFTNELIVKVYIGIFENKIEEKTMVFAQWFSYISPDGIHVEQVREFEEDELVEDENIILTFKNQGENAALWELNNNEYNKILPIIEELERYLEDTYKNDISIMPIEISGKLLVLRNIKRGLEDWGIINTIPMRRTSSSKIKDKKIESEYEVDYEVVSRLMHKHRDEDIRNIFHMAAKIRCKSYAAIKSSYYYKLQKDRVKKQKQK